MTFASDPENLEGGLTLTDETTGETRGVAAGQNDFSQWWLPATSVPLQISLSRWGHDLRIRQRQGEEYSVVPGSSYADLTLLDGAGWYSPYHLFDASGFARPHAGLDWQVYDADTGEVAAWNQTDLTGWIALRQPHSLQVCLREDGAISLAWGLEGMNEIGWLIDGGFYVEREINRGGWMAAASGAVSAFFNSEDNNDSFIFAEAASEDWVTCRHRVAYYYGTPPQRSAWVMGDEIALRAPPPQSVQAVQTAPTALELRWQIAADMASQPPEGSFLVELLVSWWTEEDGQVWGWQPEATVTAASILKAGTINQFVFPRTGLVLGNSYRYRITYSRNGLSSVPVESNTRTLVLAADGDEDGDGMPNGWEQTHSLNPLVNTASGDADGDGWTNIEEYRMGTDPRRNTVRLTVTAPFEAVFTPGATAP